MRFRKIVLIIPPSPWLISDRDIPMLGILYLSSYLKKYYEVEVEVCDLSGLSEPDWYIPIGDIYGVTGTSPHFIYMKRIIDILKDREPDKPVIVGGVHATLTRTSLIIIQSVSTTMGMSITKTKLLTTGIVI